MRGRWDFVLPEPDYEWDFVCLGFWVGYFLSLGAMGYGFWRLAKVLVG